MRRLLVIRFGALGDLVHVSPSFQAVKRAHPETEIHLLTAPGLRKLAELLPGVDRIWTWEKKQGWAALFKLAVEFRQMGVDGVVNLHPSFKSLLITSLLWPARSAVYHKEKLKEKGAVQRSIPRRHATADFYQPFMRLLGLPNEQNFKPCLRSQEYRSVGSQKQAHERWVGIIPGVGGKRSNRAWEPDAYVALIQALLIAQPDLRILLVGGPDESLLAERLLTRLLDGAERVENHCGRHDIPGTAALLAQCDLVIGGDTGPIHLAAATGVPLLGLYGPTSLARTGPVALGKSRMLTPPPELACWPCELADCPYTGEEHLACMRRIDVETVTEAALTLLKD